MFFLDKIVIGKDIYQILLERFYCFFTKFSLYLQSNKKQTMAQFGINERFEFLKNLTNMVICEISPSLVITGEGGLGKTYSVLETIGESFLEKSQWVQFKGFSTARGLYNTLFDNNGKLIVFDDCDSILEDKVALNILKSALDSYETRTISWMSKMNKSDEYPNQFNFTGRIIFISNKSKSSIDQAILSRSLTVDLSMNLEEKIERMSHILKDILPQFPIEVKTEALNFLKDQKDNKNITIRSLITVSKLRNTFQQDWKNMATYMINS